MNTLLKLCAELPAVPSLPHHHHHILHVTYLNLCQTLESSTCGWSPPRNKIKILCSESHTVILYTIFISATKLMMG